MRAYAGGVGRRQIEFKIRADLVDQVVAQATSTGVGAGVLVEPILRRYLTAPTLGGLAAARGVAVKRLRLRLPADLAAELAGSATALTVAPRLLVESALAMHFTPAAPSWDLGHRPKV